MKFDRAMRCLDACWSWFKNSCLLAQGQPSHVEEDLCLQVLLHLLYSTTQANLSATLLFSTCPTSARMIFRHTPNHITRQVLQTARLIDRGSRGQQAIVWVKIYTAIQYIYITIVIRIRITITVINSNNSSNNNSNNNNSNINNNSTNNIIYIILYMFIYIYICTSVYWNCTLFVACPMPTHPSPQVHVDPPQLQQVSGIWSGCLKNI